MSHEHSECEHEVRYCKHCDVCWCKKCKREWSRGYPWYVYTPSYPAPIVTWTSGTITSNVTLDELNGIHRH